MEKTNFNMLAVGGSGGGGGLAQINRLLKVDE
jgi:hypothetical protein